MADKSGLESLITDEVSRTTQDMREQTKQGIMGQLQSSENEEEKTDRDFSQIAGDMWRGLSDFDKAAILTAPIPIVGDIVGGIADSIAFKKDPSWLNAAFLAGGLLPFVPSGTALRLSGKLGVMGDLPKLEIPKDAKQKAFTNLRNYIPGFYKEGITKPGQVAAYGKTVPEGLTNILKARYDPKSKALQQEYNISVADKKAAKQALKVINREDPKIKLNEAKLKQLKKEGKQYIPGEFTKEGNPIPTPEYKKLDDKTKELRTKANDAGKKAMGQLNQSRSMTKQFFGSDTGLQGLLKNFDEVDHIKTFDNFNETEYFETVGDLIPEEIGRDGVNEIFKQIRTLPAIGFNRNKNYQMNIRRVATQSAGQLDPGMKAQIYSVAKKTKKEKDSKMSLQNIKDTIFFKKIEKKVRNPETGRLKKDPTQTKVVPIKYTSDIEFLEALDNAGLRVLNRDAVLKGKPAILTGSAKTDAYELGGVNYMTAINKDGKVTSILNDEHDLLGGKIPRTNIEVGKLPGGDRYMNVSEPITYDLLKDKKLTTKQKKLKSKLAKEKKKAAKNAIKNYEKIPGVITEGKVPEGFKSRENWIRAQAVALIEPTKKDWSRIQKDVGIHAPLRIGKVFLGEDEQETRSSGGYKEKKKGGSIIERNPYGYPPKAI